MSKYVEGSDIPIFTLMLVMVLVWFVFLGLTLIRFGFWALAFYLLGTFATLVFTVALAVVGQEANERGRDHRD